jgi:hypothetical protein
MIGNDPIPIKMSQSHHCLIFFSLKDFMLL